MPRYVILEHDYPHRHWDLMLEAGEVLRTWRLAEPPESGKIVPAEASFDHRKVYLDYEGAIAGGRGSVVRWDFGIFYWLVNESDQVVVILAGAKWSGKIVLSQDHSGAWTCAFDI